MSEQQLKNDIDMLDGTLDGSMVEPEEVATWERVKSALQSAHATRPAPAGSGEAVYQCRRNGEAWVDLSKAEFDFAKGRNDFSDVEFRMLYPAQPAPQRVAVPEGWKVEREEEPDGFKITFANGGTLRVCEETSGAVEHTLCMLLSHISAAPQPDGVGDGMQARHDLMLALFKRYRYETPLGNQPHMIAHEADAAIEAAERALLAKGV